MIALFYFVLFIFIIIFELLRKKQRQFDYLTFFNIYFIGYYIYPAFMMNANFLDYTSRYYRYLGNTQGTFKACALILLSYIIIVLSYLFTRTKNNKNIDFYANDNKKEYSYLKQNLLIKKINIFLVVIGIISFVIYGSMFGGVKQLLLYAGNIRGGLISAGGDGSLEFIRRFTVALMYPSYFLFNKYLVTKKDKTKLMISFVLAGVWLVSNAGRGAVLQYILILYLTYLLAKNKKINLRKFILLFAVIFIGINYLRPIFMSLMYLQDGFNVFWDEFLKISSTGRYVVGGMKDVLYNLAYYLEHKYTSLEISIMAVDSGWHNMNFFYEIIIAIVSIIPSKFIFFSKPDSIIFYNTLYITGNYESLIPPGYIALGYYSFSLVGVIIFSWLFGVIGKKLNDYFSGIKFYSADILYVSVMFIWLDIFVAGELRQTLQRFFVLIIVLIYFTFKYNGFMKKFKKGRLNE